jgi:hypothetical protein
MQKDNDCPVTGQCSSQDAAEVGDRLNQNFPQMNSIEILFEKGISASRRSPSFQRLTE